MNRLTIFLGLMLVGCGSGVSDGPLDGWVDGEVTAIDIQAGQCNSISDCSLAHDPQCQRLTCYNHACGVESLADGTSCDDENADTIDDSCRSGQCAGVPSTCGNDVCDRENGEDCNICPDDCGCANDQICLATGNCCQRQCDGRECGQDGCGGTCGSCLTGQQCSDGLCQDQPDCGNGMCEPEKGETCDGCVQDCACDKDAVCMESGQCCTPSCGVAECGSDGCGGSCGECTSGKACEDGTCVDLVSCGNGNCEPGLNEDCETCPADCGCTGDAVCLDGSCCTPFCGGAECGTDGCGGTCGSCEFNEICDSDGGICEKVCDIASISKDQVFDFDLKTLRVTGTVTRNGSPIAIPEDDSYRGGIVFSDRETFDEIYLGLGTGSNAYYDFNIFPGTYDIFFEPSSNHDSATMPHQRIRLAENVEVFQELHKDFDIGTARVSGHVTRNGEEIGIPEADEYRGGIVFSNRITRDEIYLTLGTDVEARYSANIFTGTYDIYFEPSSNHDSSVMPYQRRLLASNIVIDKDTVRDFDIQVVRFTFKMTMNGQEIGSAASGKGRGSFELRNREWNSEYDLSIKTSGPVNFYADIFPGTYDIYFKRSDTHDYTVTPMQTRRLASGVAVADGTLLVYDLKTANFSGTLTRNGEDIAAPASGKGRGVVTLVNRDEYDEIRLGLGTTGPAHYGALVFTGNYDVYFDKSQTHDYTVTPMQRRVLVQDLTISGDVVRDIDMTTGEFTGKLTRDGADLAAPASGKIRGHVTLVNPANSNELRMSLGTSGPASYWALVFPGTYDVYFDPYVDLDTAVLPEQRHLLARGVQVGTGTVRNFDVTTVRVSGTVTRNGSAVPIPGTDKYRGGIVFKDKYTYSKIYMPLGTAATASYSGDIFAGTYDVMFQPSTSQDNYVLPPLDKPLLDGCLPSGTVVEPPTDDITGKWIMSTAGYSETTTVIIVQTGNLLTGTWSGSGQGGNIQNGSRTGNRIHFEMANAYCRSVIEGEVTGKNTMQGTSTITECSAPDPVSTWTAVRN